jgi:hypothetical protein
MNLNDYDCFSDSIKNNLQDLQTLDVDENIKKTIKHLITKNVVSCEQFANNEKQKKEEIKTQEEYIKVYYDLVAENSESLDFYNHTQIRIMPLNKDILMVTETPLKSQKKQDARLKVLHEELQKYKIEQYLILAVNSTKIVHQIKIAIENQIKELTIKLEAEYKKREYNDQLNTKIEEFLYSLLTTTITDMDNVYENNEFKILIFIEKLQFKQPPRKNLKK